VDILIVILLLKNINFDLFKKFHYFAALFFGTSGIINVLSLITSIIQCPGESFFSVVQYAAIFILILLFTLLGQGFSLALLLSSKLNFFLDTENMRMKALMSEMNHRIKNNLSIIYSLVSLKQGETQNEELKSNLETINNKILSIQLIHDKLAYNEYFTTVELHPYLDDLLCEILNISIKSKNSIKYSIECPNIQFPIKELVILALITNELLLNSIKHVFPSQDNGKIEIQLLIENAMITFSYNDFGSGIDTQKSQKNTESMGLQLIKTLSAQLNGKLNIEKTKDYIFQLVFPMPETENNNSSPHI